ncbi:nuclear transport factor 2 family protein [Alkalihalobacillus sp. BA299]|uniref:nuclear transport factor 2 family protein n=1 Tax=Alkalihalobacillus sp. BA299 TaxID=2815938 RepID=UPI001FFE16CB|nr:nuclear transport factor 2 family protein [Alkalihalobacillus sp. BA299]
MKIEEKSAIIELLYRAAYGYDERNLDILGSCFAEAATMTVCIAGEKLVGPFEGHQAIMKLMTSDMESQAGKRRHVISNILFEDVGEKSAKVISYLTLYSVENGQIHVISSGIYRDEVVKLQGGWRLQKRHLDLDLAL